MQRSEALITPEYRRDVCYVDTPILLRAKGEKEVITSCEKLLFEMGGIPHWGKNNDILLDHVDRLEETHPDLSRWKEVVRRYNPHDTFTSKFIRALDLGG